MNGSMRKHGKAVGYLVECDGKVQSACFGYSDANRIVMLGGNPATLFKSRREAQRAIDASVKDRPGHYSIVRVAPLV